MKTTTPHTTKAFTLIELLVVIAVISLLSSIIYASVSSAREKAAVAKSSQEIRQISNAFELASDGSGSYPVQMNLQSAITPESALAQGPLAGTLNNIPQVSPTIGSSDEEERNYYYISSGASPIDSDGNVYSCGGDDESYVVMYKRVVDNTAVFNFEGYPNDNSGALLDEDGKKVVTISTPVSPYGTEYVYTAPLVWSNPTSPSYPSYPWDFDKKLYHITSTGSQCDSISDSCTSYNYSVFSMEDNPDFGEVGYYICE